MTPVEQWADGWKKSFEQTQQWQQNIQDGAKNIQENSADWQSNLGANIGKGIENWWSHAWQNWIDGWKQSFGLTADWIIPMATVICIMGVFCSMAGFTKIGKRCILGSILTSIILKAVF